MSMGVQSKVSLKTVLSYGMGSFGNNIIYALTSTYLMIFYTDSVGLNAAAVGTLFLIARIWDGIADIIIGIIVDNTETRFGKFRPYLLIGGFFAAVATVACFISPDLSHTGKLIYAYITYIAWGTSFAIMDIPYWSLSATITQDVKERNKVVAFPRTIAAVGSLFASLLTLPLAHYFGNWFMLSLIYACILMITMIITFSGVKENYTVKRQEKQTPKAVWNLFIQNKPLRYLIFSMLLVETILTIRTTFSIYYFKYNLNAENIASLYLTLFFTAQIVGAIASPFISNKFGKKRAAIGGIALNAVATLTMFATGFHVMPVMILSFLASFGGGVSNIAQTSMLADCVEYGEWKTGNRAEGMVFSTNIFKTKVASAVGGAVGGYILSAVGYVPNQIQSHSTLIWIALIFTIIPGILCLLSLVPLVKYELTEKRYLEILQDMKKRSSRIKEKPAMKVSS